MFVFAFYLLKVMLCSGILLGYYWLMLRNKIFHQYNRFYLLGAVVLSMVLPLVEIPIWQSADATATGAIQLLQVADSSAYLEEIIVNKEAASINLEQALGLVYATITLLLLVFFVHALVKIRRLFVNNQHSLVDDVYFVNTTAKGTPFSFLRYIFWNDHIDPESVTGSQVFRHELAHVQQKHSYDKLLLNTVLVVCWCNPFFWLIRKELSLIHEFIADKIAVEDSDAATFAAMILQAAYPQHRFHFTHPFFYSPIKRRLMMITKNRNPKVGYIGRLLALPLAILVFAAFTLKAKTFHSNYDGPPITVVIDAGHGGTDFGAINPQKDVTEKDLNLSITKMIQSLNTNKQIKIILTRQSDVLQTPREKVAFTKKANANLFISVHMGAYTGNGTDKKSGLNTWIAGNNPSMLKNSQLLASALIQEFNQQFKLPVRQQPQLSTTTISVLKESTCPAVLIEPGYITNNDDLTYLQTTAAKKTIATNILAAVEKWAIARENGFNEAAPTSAVTNKMATGKVKDTVPTNLLQNYLDALLIVDGKTTNMQEVNKIDPKTIASITVLKSKEAIALYGEKGKNGVVIIVTKQNAGLMNGTQVRVKQKDSSNITKLIGVANKNSNQPKPLYVLDGIVKEENYDLSELAPNDIQSINVLKGESATTKYGDKGKNGVVEISTKGKEQQVDISLSETMKNKVSNDEVVVVGYGDNSGQGNPNDDKVFIRAEKEPEFPGGKAAWIRYLQKNLDAGMPNKEGWKPGTYQITISFIVKKDGSIADIKTNNYPGSLTAEHCIDLIRKGPKWIPAVQNGHKVNAYQKQPITFIVEKKTTS